MTSRMISSGGSGRFPDIHPYVAADVFAALNKLAPYDWEGFFHQRLTSLSADAPLGGLAASGWKLVMDESPNRFVQDWAERSAMLDLRFSLGLLLGEDGSIEDVIEASPADRAGMFPGGRIVALNGRTWSNCAMEEGLRATPSTPLVLRVEFAGGEREYSLDYHGGPRYPHLQRVADSPDLLSAIFAERGAGSAGEAGASEATAASLRDAALRGQSVAYDFVRDLTTLGPRPAGAANDGIAAQWAWIACGHSGFKISESRHFRSARGIAARNAWRLSALIRSGSWRLRWADCLPRHRRA
jgi:hypothetical protein